MEELIERLEGTLFTVISGIFLALSLALSLLSVSAPVDPAWVSAILSGIPLVYGAIWKLLKNKGVSRISSALLITIAMIASIAIGDVFAAGEIAFIMAIGEILEDKTTARARKGLKNLLNLAPTQGCRITDKGEEMIDADQIRIGDILRILPGETIPADGIIVTGQTSVDQAVITGESLPVDKGPGDRLFCGTINRFGSVDMEATCVGQDSSLQKLIRMVKDAEDKKAPIQRIADRWASFLVPVALLLAVIAGVIRQDIVVAVTILVVFCPCALVLATPTAIMAAIGQATRHGVIIKSGEALEAMGKVDLVAMDKTGTLTEGKLQVSDVYSFEPDLSEEQLLTWTAAAESRSEHPLAKAIVAGRQELPQAEEFTMTAGRGVKARVEGHEILCGNLQFLEEKGVAVDETRLSSLLDQGKAMVLTAVDGRCVGAIGLSDKLRDSACETVKQLTHADVDIVLLTGDNRKAAEFFAQQAGIANVEAQLLPMQKVETIEKLQNQGHHVCMVGDGVNDAPALKTAQVGVAMGAAGSDIAVEAADVAIMSDDISKLPYLKKLSNGTRRTIRTAITLSLAINFAAIVLSFFRLLTPTTGALFHNLGSVLVILFAALLYDRKFK